MRLSTLSFLCVFAAVSAVAATEAPPAPAMSVQEFNNEVRRIGQMEQKKPAAAVKEYRGILGKGGLTSAQKLQVLTRIARCVPPPAGDKDFADVIAEIRAFPAADVTTACLSLLTGEFPSEELGRMKGLLKDVRPQLSDDQLIGVYRRFAIVALGGADGAGEAALWFGELRKLRDLQPAEGQKPATVETQKQKRRDAVAKACVDVVAEAARIDGAAAEKFYQGEKSLFDADEKSTQRILVSLITAARAGGDREAFDRSLAALKAMPDTPDKLGALVSVAGACRNTPIAMEILTSLLTRQDLDDKSRVAVLSSLRDACVPQSGPYGFIGPNESYKMYKDYSKQLLAILEKDEKNANLTTAYRSIGGAAFTFGDYAFASELMAKALARSPKDYGIVEECVLAAMRAKDNAAVKKLVADYASLVSPDEPSIPDREKQSRRENARFLRALEFLSAGGKLADFDKAVLKDETLAPGDRYRLLSRLSFTIMRSGRYEICQAIRAEIYGHMFKPVERHEYAVRYQADVPRTADAWARSSAYNEWKDMETRFWVYDMYEDSFETDINRHLKGATNPPIDQAERAGIQFVCSDEGLHIFVRSDCTNTADILSGKINGCSLELLFRPGSDSAYHWWMMGDLPKCTDAYCVNWMAPGKDYTFTYDYFTRDATVTKEAVVAHTFIPWIMYSDKLPINGRDWTFGMQRWGGKQPLTINGAVHELSRMLHLAFTFTPQQLASIRRATALRAYHDYANLRKDWLGVVRIWQDAVLGDPAFYDAKIAPLVKDLDEAGAKLEAGIPDSEMESFYDTYVTQWADIRYIVQDMRTAYLRDSLLTEDRK